jgi:hypothetical protein
MSTKITYINTWILSWSLNVKQPPWITADAFAIDEPSYPSSVAEVKSLLDVFNEPNGWVIDARE